MASTVFTNDNIQGLVNHEYLKFLSELQSKRFYYDGKQIEWKSLPMVDGKDATFFHLITVDYSHRDQYCCPDNSIICEKDFDYNPMMAESYPKEKRRSICGFRMMHYPTIISVFRKSDNLIWHKTATGSGGRKTRIHILDQQHKYYVILQQNRNGKILLWTAYPVSSDKINDLKRDYKRHVSSKKHLLMVK